MRISLFCLCVLLIVTGGVQALTFSSVAISPQNATTTATLSCVVSVVGTGTLNANVTWFRSGVAHVTDNETISLTSGVDGSTTVIGNVEAADTTKGDAWLCQVTVGNGTTTNSTNSSTVTIQNSAPVLTSPTTTQSVTEDSTYALNATASDADGDSIVTWISSDLNASNFLGNSLFTVGATGEISFTPAQSAVGNHTMALLAYDGESFGGQNVLFTVVEVNDPPLFTVFPTDRNATVGENFSITVTGSDEEDDPFNFSMQTGNANLIITYDSNTSATITFVGGAPSAADIGIIGVNVTAYEIANASVNNTASFSINVTQPNQDPVLATISDQNGTQGLLFTLFVNATDNDTTDTLFFNTSTNCSLTNPWSITTTNNTSTGAVGLINLTLTNDHVACPYVNITVYDMDGNSLGGGSDVQVVYFNITNVNDPPELANLSYNSSNSQHQQDMRALSAGTGNLFVYQVNGSDPDQLTYAGDTLTFTDDSALFFIDPNTGIISFTPTIGDVGTHLINVTLTDTAGLNVNATLNLTIYLNYPPWIDSPGTIYCQEDVVCTYNVTANDSDPQENLTFSANTSLATFTQATYNISTASATFVNGNVGNHTILLTVTDRFGYTNTTTYTLVINNSNDAPFFDNDFDLVADSITVPTPIVTGLAHSILVNASDPDLVVSTDTLTFAVSVLSGPNSSLFTLNPQNAQQTYIAFTPGPFDAGDYVVNVSVTDAHGASAEQNLTFTIENASIPPVITAVQPYFDGLNQENSSLTAIANTTDDTDVTFAENETIVFNLTYDDNDTVTANMTIYWYRDGTLITSTTGSVTNLTYAFDFFASGVNNITAVVMDNLLSQDNFTWHVTVTNVNRPPVLASAFSNRTLNATTTLSSEMEHFIDPDDDLDSDLQLDLTETSSLTYSMSASTILDAEFSDTDVTLTPSASGIETITYTATDGDGETVDSNNITYIVVYNPEESSSASSSGGGGGGGASSSTVITREVEKPEPYAIDILTPKAITIYENETVIAPLAITNTGTVLLSGITLSAQTDANVTLAFLDEAIPELAVNESYNTSLAITGYKYQGTYEVFVTAHVEDPAFNDSAVIYINSMETSREGQNAVNVKITYARDLLTDNPACGELVQLVNQAEQAYRLGNSAEAERLLGAVSEGCTYLKAQAAKELEQPGLLGALAGYQYTNVFLGILLVGLLIIGGFLVAHYAKQQ